MTQSPSLPELPKPAELLPCPFCGGAAHCHDYRGGAGYWQVECQDCDATTDGRRIKSDAIEVWNRRTCYEAGSAAAAQAAWQPIGWQFRFVFPTHTSNWHAMLTLPVTDMHSGDDYHYETRLIYVAAPTQGAEGAAPQAKVCSHCDGSGDDCDGDGEGGGGPWCEGCNGTGAALTPSPTPTAPPAAYPGGSAPGYEEKRPVIERSECALAGGSCNCDPDTVFCPVHNGRAVYAKPATPTAPQEADALREALIELLQRAENFYACDVKFSSFAVARDAMDAARAALAQHQPQQGEQR